MPRYHPPFTLTPKILRYVSEIADALSRWSAQAGKTPSPVLRRGQRIRSIQASLAIENNSLSIEQVTAVIAGKRVLAPPREVLEVRNAFAAYEHLPHWKPAQRAHLLKAHLLLMSGLMDAPGVWRSQGVGIYRGKKLLHMAPPATRVPKLMQDLFAWLKLTDTHPLLASCVFHYEFEFIHPFADGNGRLGRLWQTLILSQWKPVLAWLPMETVIRDQQDAYYAALAASDRASDSTAFIEFMLAALLTALREALSLARPTAASSDPVSDYVTPAVKRLLAAFKRNESLTAVELMRRLGLSHRPSFLLRYLQPAITAGLIELTDPVSPRSLAQKYRRGK
jgi:Fic family protein